MSLRTKVAIIVLSIFIVYGVADSGVQRFIILPSFLSLEHEEAIKNSNRAVQAIQREIYYLDALNHDWSAWDDTYEFTNTRSKEYIEENVPLTAFTDNNLNLIYYYNTDGKVIWGEIHDLEKEELIHLSDFPKESLPKTHPLLSFKTSKRPLSEVTVKGVFMTEKGPMLIASRPILTNNNEGPIRGALIMGRFFNDNIVKTLIEQTKVDFKVLPIQADSLPAAMSDIPNRLTEKMPYSIKKSGDGYLDTYTAFPDIKGNKAFIVKSSLPRKIAAKGYSTIRFAIYSILAAGLIVLTVMLLLLQRTIVNPLTKLTKHTLSVGETGDLSARISIQRQDEIGILSNELNKMLKQLEKRSLELEAVNISLKDEITERKRIEKELQTTITDLKKASTEIKTLRGILPLCSFCKKIRDDKGYWEKVDVYIHKHSQADISHGICPECMKKHYPEEYQSVLDEDE